MRVCLKTKLVLAISGMVVVVVATLSAIYILHTVQRALGDAYAEADFVGHQVFVFTHDALHVHLGDSGIDFDNSEALRPVVEETLRRDAGLQSLLQSVIGHSPTIFDVAIVDPSGRALLHTDADRIGKALTPREQLSSVVNGSFRRQMEVVFGGPKIYELRIPLERDKQPFGEIRIGVSTMFLKDTLEPQVKASILFSLLAVAVSLVLAAILCNLLLKPLEDINRHLNTNACQEPNADPKPSLNRSGAQ